MPHLRERPVRAKHPDSQCCAFTKDHRRCRLTRSQGQKTCLIHRNYYYQWFDTMLFHKEGLSWYSLSRRQRYEIEFQLRHKHVILTESDVQSFTRNPYTLFPQKLIEWGAIDPFWIESVFQGIITTLFTNVFHEWPSQLAVDELQVFVNSLGPCLRSLTFFLDNVLALSMVVLTHFEEPHMLEHSLPLLQLFWNSLLHCPSLAAFAYRNVDWNEYILAREPFFERFLIESYYFPEHRVKDAYRMARTHLVGFLDGWSRSLGTSLLAAMPLCRREFREELLTAALLREGVVSAGRAVP